MRNRTSLIFALCTSLIATAWPQLALAEHQITTIDPPGAGTAPGQGTFPQQNLNSGVIVGYYVDAKNVSHGFIRSRHGKYTTIDIPGAAGTQAFGINDEGKVVGWSFEANGVYHGFLRDEDGRFTTFDVPGAGPYQPQGSSPLVVLPIPQAINRSGAVAGNYLDKNNVSHGFVRSSNGHITSFDPAGSVGTFGDTNGINRDGTIAGGYMTADSVFHCFVRDPHGAITSFDGPGSGTIAGGGSVVETLNDAGTTPGVSMDNNGVDHGFIRYSDGTFVSFDVAGAGTGPIQNGIAQGTIAAATNMAGTTAGNYTDANYVAHGFVRSRHGRITTYDVPGEGSGFGQGVVGVGQINDEGAVVGWFVDANGAYHGFIYQGEDD